MGLLMFLALAVSGEPAVVLHPTEVIALRDRRIRLGDLAGLSPEARAPGLASRVIAILPAPRRSVTLPRGALVDLVRRAVPGLAVRGGPQSVVFRFDVQPPPVAMPCFALASPAALGALLQASDLAPAPCAERATTAPIRFDQRAGAVRAAQPLAGGTYIGRVNLTTPPDIEQGQALTVVSTAGPVRIERPVTALQDGRRGRRAFVRDADGQVFSVSVSAAPEGSE